ncbi:MAG: CDP-glycerol glycerophosphotransferase family protein [Lachnospiraceae bacterium]|nr:CDP-glycerol glycerophosphotransferase family protein [Lachnospiraceae bacterium]
MIKNVMIKKILKSTVFKGITLINKIYPKKDNIILLYMGNKGLGFNLEPLYDYLVREGFNEKYNIICSVESDYYFGCNEKNVLFVNHIGAIKWYLKAKHVFYTAGQLPIKPSKKQIVIHMNHGITDYKTMGALTKINNGDELFFTYMIAPSEIYIPIFSKEYLCPENCIKVCSEPMVDRIIYPLTQKDYSAYNKVLLWVPTFRQSDYLGYNDSSQEDLIPLFNEEKYKILNDHLAIHNCLLIVKIHPSQTLGKYKQENYSHLKIYSNENFINEGMNLYDLMAQADGLIGDYSSASLQFLLTNKPVAYVIPDFEEYQQKRGFVFNNVKDYMPGHLIYTEEDFWKFLEDFSKGIDNYKKQRLSVRDIIHKYDDGKSCERILELSMIYR